MRFYRALKRTICSLGRFRGLGFSRGCLWSGRGRAVKRTICSESHGSLWALATGSRLAVARARVRRICGFWKHRNRGGGGQVGREGLSAQSILSGKAAKCIFRALHLLWERCVSLGTCSIAFCVAEIPPPRRFVVGAVCIFGHVPLSPPPPPLPSPPLHSFTLPKLSITMSTGARHHEHHVAHVAQGGRFAGLKTQKAFAKRVLGHLSRIRASCRGAFRGARKTHRPRAAFRGARKTHRTPSRYGSTRSRVQGLQARKTHVCRGAFGGVQKTHRLPTRSRFRAYKG